MADNMSKSNISIFAIPSELNGMLNASSVPKKSSIFCHEDRWWFELKTGPTSENELQQRESNFEALQKLPNYLDVALGPFDFEPVSIEIKLLNGRNPFLYLITSINGCPLKAPVQRTRSPITSITFDSGAMRDAFKIPDGASHCCWLNGSDIIESNAINAKPNEAIMLLDGGFAYLSSDQVDNCSVIEIKRFQPTGSGRVQITKSEKWRHEYTQTLLDQDRFARCSHIAFVLAGLRHYAFINANEELTNSNDPSDKWTPTQAGAFLYLINEDKSENTEDYLYELSPFPLGTAESN